MPLLITIAFLLQGQITNKVTITSPCSKTQKGKTLTTFYNQQDMPLSHKTFNNSRLRQSKHTRLSHKLTKHVFIIFYKHYLPKISELKNQVFKLRFKI
jgi:hypothetical protein